MADELSLWCDTPEEDSAVLEKIKSPKKVAKKSKKSKSLSDKLINVKNEVYRILGKHAEDTLTIYSKEDYFRYINKCINNGIVAVDTETNNSTEPITCKLMGPCLYTWGEKQVYIPTNHVNIDTRERLPNQLTEEDIREGLQKLVDHNVKMVFHNATFDIRVIQCTCGIELPCYWDTRVACRILDENESNKEKSGLKYQYMIHIDPHHGKYDIEKLFDGLEYAIIPPELFALYASTDPMMTLKLYAWQKEQFEKAGNENLYKLFMNVEIPLVKVVKDMELRGINIDLEYHARLKNKYDIVLAQVDRDIEKAMEDLQPKIDAWRKTPEANYKEEKIGKDGKVTYGKSKSEQLEDPIKLSSPTQFAILLYDILKVPAVNKETPRGTSEEIIDAIYKETGLDICRLLIERRGYVKLLSTYIDNIPPLLNIWKDGMIRAGFDQNGTDTGRFTSGGKIKLIIDGHKEEIPGINLQTIPSHNKEIRMLYCGGPGQVIVGSDFSAQEPRLTSHMSGDENMLNAYLEGKDLYSEIASLSFGVPYEDCLEFYPEGTIIEVDGQKIVCGKKTHQNKLGKERRTQAKSILLGLEYGRGATSIGEQINKSKEEAQEIINKFFRAFPKVEKWINDTHRKVKKVGYVEDFYGRRRRLPNIFLPEYDIELKDKDKEEANNFNPFLLCEDRTNSEFDKLKKQYEIKLKACKFSAQRQKVVEEARKHNIVIKNNSNLIAEAERQSVNAIIQGGAATLTKLAMINISKDPELNRLGFQLLSTIHDEVFGKCPEENGEAVAKRLTQVMVDTAKPFMKVPMSCDPYTVHSWYEDEYGASLLKEYKDLEKSGLPKEQSLEKLFNNHPESTKDFIIKLLESV